VVITVARSTDAPASADGQPPQRAKIGDAAGRAAAGA
jgi:hypothetical protein